MVWSNAVVEDVLYEAYLIQIVRTVDASLRWIAYTPAVFRGYNCACRGVLLCLIISLCVDSCFTTNNLHLSLTVEKWQQIEKRGSYRELMATEPACTIVTIADSLLVEDEKQLFNILPSSVHLWGSFYHVVLYVVIHTARTQLVICGIWNKTPLLQSWYFKLTMNAVVFLRRTVVEYHLRTNISCSLCESVCVCMCV